MQKLKAMNDGKIELFGLRAADGSEWKLIMNGYGTNWVEVRPIHIKPPLGLKPKWVHDDQRKIEILQAIERYNIAGIAIPKEWQEELNNLNSIKT